MPFSTQNSSADRLQDRRFLLRTALSVGLILLTWSVFAGSISAEFLNFDDNSYVYENPEITGGLTLHGLKWMFTHAHSTNWHPLTTLSHMLDCQIYGVQPRGHHFTNVLLHTLAVVLCFLALDALTGNVWRSGFIAAVFAIHPLRAESVAWISERKDVLSGVFFMLTLLAYVNYVRRGPSLGRYVALISAFLLGLMSKSMLVTLPLVLLCLDYWPLRRFQGTRSMTALVIEKIPLLVLSAVFCAITLLAQHETLQSNMHLQLSARAANAINNYSLYFGQLLWPASLSGFYPYQDKSLTSATTVFSFLFLSILTAIVIAKAKSQPYLFLGWLWYLIMLLPVSGIIQVGRQAHADRYTYLSQIGLILMFTWAVAEMVKKLPFSSRALPTVGCIVIIALASLARAETSHWHDSQSLWTRALAVTTNNDTAHAHLGAVLLQGGAYDRAIAHLQAAVDINPDNDDAYNSLGIAFGQSGQLSEASEFLQKSLAINPSRSAAHNNLGNIWFQKGEFDRALAEFKEAIHTDPNSATAYLNLGAVYFRQGKFELAIASYRKQIECTPNSADAHFSLANAYWENGQHAEAISEYRATLRINPNYPDGQTTLSRRSQESSGENH